MSDCRNVKFKKHSSRLRRRSRSSETPDSFANYREVESQETDLDSETSVVPLQPSQGGSSRQTRDEAIKNANLEILNDERSETGVASCSGLTKPPECAICLQPSVHPARLPCTHVFCYLCLKGIARGPRTCAMCRAPIPPDYTENPELVPVQQEVKEEPPEAEVYTWFYEGRNGSGWWQYDTRTSAELELCSQRGDTKTEVLIAGCLYTIDFEEMVQARKNEPARRRTIKRDLITCPKKGIAGLRQPVLSGLTESLTQLNLGNNPSQQD